MNSRFYPRLAVTGIRNNKSIYLPYLLSGSLIVLLFYVLSSVSVMVTDAGSETMGTILNLSTWICGMLSVVFLFYINSFVMKRRKKEFGLYSILGMEKRHISFMMFWEVLISSVLCLVAGIGGGALFSQLTFLLLLKMAGLPTALTFQIPFDSVLVTCLLFGAVFLAVLLFDVIAIMRANPIAMLRSASEGEREPKARWLITLAGLATLLGGYGLAWWAQTPGQALQAFFFAVLLVIAGTYCLFIAGSIVMLKLLRRNKNFYYKPKNFVSVSGMLYRMKQNATGLANICILATCVLVTLSSTVCLFLGQNDILSKRFYRQVVATCIADEQSAGLMQSAAEAHAAEYGMTVKNPVGHYIFSFATSKDGGHFEMQRHYNANTLRMNVIILEDYNRITGASESLEAGQALLYLQDNTFKNSRITLENQEYEIKARISQLDFIDTVSQGKGMVLVVSGLPQLTQIQDSFNAKTDGSYAYKIDYRYQFDVSGNEARLEDYYATMRSALNQSVPHLSEVDNIDYARTDFYQIFGSLLFVGIFFVALFLIATVLIIYYKQITEGFDDRERFQIMQKVGMSDREVKSTIQKQVRLVFFLPLGAAVVHIIVAFKVLVLLLTAFQMYNVLLFLGCTIGVVLVFTIFYYAVYHMTARTYYRILQTKH